MRGTKFGTSRTLNKPIQWLLRDEFSDTRAAGSVNGTMPTPGPGGARIINDSLSRMSISSGEYVASGQSAGAKDPSNAYGTFSRVAGRMLLCKIMRLSAFGGGDTDPMAGWFTSSAGAFSNNEGGALFDGASTMGFTSGGSIATITAISNDTYYTVFYVLRAAGFSILISSGTLILMHWTDTRGSTSSLYAQIANIAASRKTPKADFMRIPSDLWLPTPLVSDGFGSTFGTSDGLGHAEGVSGGIGSGGGNRTLTQQIGTWANSAGKAAAATLSGGVAVATVPLSTADVFAKVKVTRSAGAGGLTLRWTDSSNYLYAEHDGTNAYLKQVLSGSTTTLITAAATYSAGAEIVVDLNGTAGRLYYNNALIGTTSSINSGLTATAHGLRSTDTGGIQLDDLCIYAKGTGGEYNLLNRYVNL